MTSAGKDGSPDIEQVAARQRKIQQARALGLLDDEVSSELLPIEQPVRPRAAMPTIERAAATSATAAPRARDAAVISRRQCWRLG